MESMVDIAVIIVNWNAREDLRQCLLSLFAEPIIGISAEVWVVDNASDDGSAPMVCSEFPQARLIANTDNLGFSKANNQAIAACQSRYVFLLNSDAVIHPGALDALVAFGDAHPAAGILGPSSSTPTAACNSPAAASRTWLPGSSATPTWAACFPRTASRATISWGTWTTTSRAPWTGFPAVPC